MSVELRMANYFMNETDSDVTILVLNKEGLLQRIPGHRFVIKSGCPKLYEDMIRNTRSERCKDMWRFVTNQRRVVRTKEVKGCLSSPLLTIMRFGYTGEIVLEPEFLLEVPRKGSLYFGEEHEFFKRLTTGEEFERLCKDYAWDYLKFADETEDHVLQEAVLHVIDENAETLFPKRGFRQLNSDLVQLLVKRDTLKIRELDLFNACLDWAYEFRRSQQQESDKSSSPRSRLSARLRGVPIFALTSGVSEAADETESVKRIMQPFLKDIRFPQMTLEDFATGPFSSGIFTSDEVNELLNVILGKQIATKFNANPRAFDNRIQRLNANEKLLDSSRVTCKVCLDHEVSLVFVPCGHLVSCSSCADQLNDCPVCRKRITSKIRTFF
jgi:hypothetical protein